MSRSVPDNRTKSPVTRWFRWSSKNECFNYWDKAEGAEVQVPLPFAFVVLDRTCAVTGFNKKLGERVYSNEVKDTRSGVLTVKYQSGGRIASGLWLDIKDKVTAKTVGGRFGLRLYIAYKERPQETVLSIGCIELDGCSLSSWFDFEQEGGNGTAIYEMAVIVKESEHKTEGSIAFNAPVFSLLPLSEEANKEAVLCDVQLQEYLRVLLAKASVGQTTEPEHAVNQPEPDPEPEQDPAAGVPPDDDDVPF